MVLRTRLRNLALRLGPARVALLGSVILALAGIEWWGRQGGSDVTDLVGLVLVGALVRFATGAHRRRSLPGFDRLKRAGLSLTSALRARVPDFGVDLREDVAHTRGVPPLLSAAATLCVAILAAEVAWVTWAGVSFRGAATSVFYLGYLALLGLLWAGLCVAAAFIAAMVVVTIHDTLQRRHRGDRRRSRRPQALWIAGFFLAVLLGGLLLPVWVSNCFLVVAFAFIIVARRALRLPPLTLLWRDLDGKVGALDWYDWVSTQAALMWWGYAILVVAALGGDAFAWPLPAVASTPITGFLGHVAAWIGGPGAVVITLGMLGLYRGALRADPSAPCPTSIHVSREQGDPRDERSVAALFESRGWGVRWDPAAPERCDVRIRLVDPPMKPPKDGRWRWPIPVSASALDAPELIELLERRDVVQRRRLLVKGLARLFRRAHATPYEKGSGFWIAPHYWFVLGLTRDTDEEDFGEDATIADGMIGPPYPLVIPLPARQHGYQVLRAVHVDIIFVEDGVAWAQVRRVLGRIFRHYDAGGGRIEEHHFVAIHKIRAVLHDLEPGGKLDKQGYPEPDYDDLGRARVLHLFKDRGGDEETDPAPRVDEGITLGA